MTSSELATMQLKGLADERSILFPLTVNQYHRMVDEGILAGGEPVELLNGYLVRKDRSASGEDPMTVGHAYPWPIAQLADLNPKFRRHGCHVRVQLPITLAPSNEPEPDGVIVRGSIADYCGRHPSAADVLCVIEVADGSLRRDRSTKLGIYAQAGIPCYMVINLVEKVVEVCTDARRPKGRRAFYQSVQSLAASASIQLPTTSTITINVSVASLLM
jgi:Uma2 family endonuclease